MYENDKILGFHSEKLKDYRIIEEIGEGGSSHVYTAYYDKLMNQKRVIKVSKNIRNDDGSREAAILTSLHNPYIPIIYEYFIENDRAILIMEHIAGDSVQQKIKAGYLFSKDEVYKFGHQLCEVVTYLHSLPNPIIHGDIKPDNVIITPAGKVCLIDFNISGISHEGKAYTNGYTKGYGAPEQRDAFYELKQRRTSEQAKAGAKADRRSDTSGSQNNGTMPGTLDLYHLPDNIDPDKTFGVFGLSGRDNSEENKTVQLLGNELDNEGHEHTEMFSDPGKGTEFLGGASPDEQSLRTKSESIVVTGSDESISGYGIEIDKRSDVYSIGATLFRMYFCDKDKSINRIDRFRASGHKKVAGRGAHDGLLFVLDKALQDNPDKRYQTAQEMLDAIDKIKVGKKYGKFLGKIMPMSAIRTIFTGLAVVVIGGGTIAASSIGLFGSGSKADRDDKNRTKISSTSTSTPTAPNAEGSTEISAVEDEPDYRTALGKIETAKTFTDPDEARAKYVEALELLNTLKTNGYEKDPLLNTQIIYCHLYMDNLDAAKNVLAGIKDTLDSETRNEIENRIEIIENSKNIDKLLQLGAEYYDSKDYTSAKSAYESALEIDRNHQNANAGLIKTLIALGNLDLAKETAGRASFTDSAVKAEIDNLYSEQESAIAKRVKDADTAKKLKKITDDFPEYAEGYEKLIDHYIANETPNKKNGKLKDAESAIDKYQTNLGGLAAGAVLRLADKYIETNTVDSLARATDLIELHTGILEKDQSIAYLNKIQSSLENLNTPVDTPTPEPTPASTGGNTNKATQAPTATPTPKPTATPTP
ncbi:MAG: protein kinase, partial [Lachnospiraceae bacterium]|nr:protein kinase [Lachnospiraceae bacterium]